MLHVFKAKKLNCIIFALVFFLVNEFSIKHVTLASISSSSLLLDDLDASIEQIASKDLNYDDNEAEELAVILKREYKDDLIRDLFETTHDLELVRIVREFNFVEDNDLLHYKFSDSAKKKHRRRKRSISSIKEQLENDDRVERVFILERLTHEKRSLRGIRNRKFKYSNNYDDDDEIDQQIKRIFEDITSNGGNEQNFDENSDIKSRDGDKINFNDKYYPEEWYLENDGQLKTPKGHDLNVKEAWLKGFTGKNCTIVIIDDGLDHEHPEFAGKYRPEVSYDYNSEDADPLPSTFDDQNNHGTKCAGAAAASGNNSLCGVGIAYGAYVGGIRILDGPVTDLLEARALAYKASDVDIKSASWGPKDDGAHMEYPGIFVNRALEEGVVKGRNGKGTIYVWASGNGGGNDDDCGADGYVSHWNVISIGSINHHGVAPFFMEFCPSTMAVVYSGGNSNMRGDPDDPGVRVIATDVRGKCTDTFQGTSSAAPLAAGAFALVLEANQNLTYRDVMYLIAKTSRIPNLEDTDGWIINGAKYHVNDRYGFGVLDVGRLVEEAQHWVNVPPRYSCFVEYQGEYPEIPPSGKITLTINVQDCPYVEQLEHTIANVSFSFTKRGDLKLTLISPSGTPSEILSYRRNDFNDKGISYFPFMSLFNWGESPIGVWTLVIESKSSMPIIRNRGQINYFALKLFGTTKSNNQISVQRFVPNDNEQTSFSPTYEDIKNKYNEEKHNSRHTRIMSKSEYETKK